MPCDRVRGKPWQATLRRAMLSSREEAALRRMFPFESEFGGVEAEVARSRGPLEEGTRGRGRAMQGEQRDNVRQGREVQIRSTLGMVIPQPTVEMSISFLA